jgi:hypothetical protein
MGGRSSAASGALTAAPPNLVVESCREDRLLSARGATSKASAGGGAGETPALAGNAVVTRAAAALLQAKSVGAPAVAGSGAAARPPMLSRRLWRVGRFHGLMRSGRASDYVAVFQEQACSGGDRRGHACERKAGGGGRECPLEVEE